MATRLHKDSAIAGANAVVARTNTGGAGTIEVRTGTQPANGTAAATGTLLATFPLANPAWGDAATFAGTTGAPAPLLGVPISATAVAAGTPGWFRVISGSGSPVFDGSVGSAPAGQLTLDSTSVVVGQVVKIVSGSYTQPAA